MGGMERKLSLKRLAGVVAVAVAIAVVAFANIVNFTREAAQAPDEKQLAAAFPEVRPEKEESGDPPVFAAMGEKGEAGAVFMTDHIGPVHIGFGGEMSLLVGMKADGEITGIVPLGHEETPAYFRSVAAEGFFERFVGRNAVKDFSDIDAVTGATVTCDAARSDIAAAARAVAKSRYKLDVPETESQPRFELVAPDLALFVLALLLALTAFFLGHPYLKWASWIFSVAVFGFWLNVSVSLPQITSLLNLHLPAGRRPEPLILLAFALVTALSGRQVYCARACPFGAMQEIAYKLAPGRLKASPAWLDKLLFLRWVILFLTVVAAVGLAYAPAASFEPFGSLFTKLTPMPIFLFAILVLAVSAFYRRFWCRLFCPTGASLKLAERMAKRTKKGGAVIETEEEDGEDEG